VAYGPGYGLVHSFVVVHVSKVVFGLVSGLWVGCLALYSIFMWTRGDTDGSSRITPFWCGRMKDTDEWTSVWNGEGAHAPLGD
jgi:hypothetical protein